MRSILAKEFRQNHLLVWVGFLLSAAIAVLYLLWTRNYVKTIHDEKELNAFCGFLMLLASGVMVLVSTAGVFSLETGRGTLSFLLGLPVSRARIWLGKGLAGLAIALSSALLLIVPLCLVLPEIPREINITPYVPDIAVAVLLVFAVTLFCSTVFQRVISVLMASVVVTATLFIGGALFLQYVGGALGYDDMLDLVLVQLILVPALLLASAITFTRGELLVARRRWGLALGSLVVGIAVTLLAYTGAVRWAYRYQRSKVMAVETQGQSYGRRPNTPSAALELIVRGSPAPFERTDAGWKRGEGHYRANHSVVLDLKTGRELLVTQAPHNYETETVISPDGRFCVAAPGGTFGSRHLDIWDLQQHRQVYSGLPAAVEEMHGRSVYALTWSPKGNLLALQTEYVRTGAGREPRQPQEPIEGTALLVFRPDGSVARKMTLWESEQGAFPLPMAGWAWAADGGAIYTMNQKGQVTRRPVAEGEPEKTWQFSLPNAALPKGQVWRFGPLVVSPDGQWLVTRAAPMRKQWGETAEAAESAKPVQNVSVTLAATYDDSRQVLIGSDSQPNELVWSQDGRYLYLARYYNGFLALARWQPGQEKAVPVAIPAGIKVQRIAPLRDGGPLVWAEHVAYWVGPQGRFAPLPGKLRDLPRGNEFLTIDTEGRIVVRSLRSEVPEIEAIDVTNGSITKIYP